MNYIPTLADWFTAPNASDVGSKVQWLYYFILYLSVFFFVAIIALMVFFVFKYRRRSPHDRAQKTPTHHLGLELAWSIPPLIIVLFVFVVGLRGFLTMTGPRANALEIKVVGKQWAWSFEYTLPDGSTFPSDELHMEVGRPVTLTLVSEDVIHSLWVPEFYVKKDAVPGRYNKVSFTPTKVVDRMPVLCAEYCGTQHSTMVTVAQVHESGMFDVWLKGAGKKPLKQLNEASPELYKKYTQVTTDEDLQKLLSEIEKLDPKLYEDLKKIKRPALEGAALYDSKGCKQCHTVDGKPANGPTFKGLWGHEVVFNDGSKTIADENYIRNSIYNPQEQIVKGFSPLMQPFKDLSAEQVDSIIAYIRSLGDQHSEE